MLTLDELFDPEGSEWHGFHDVVVDSLRKALSAEELRALFLTLPRHIQGTGYTWGVSDTVFRDSAYVFLQKQATSDQVG